MSVITDSLQDILQRARERRKNGQLTEADSLYRELLQEAPNVAQNYFEFGTLQIQCGRNVDAVALMQGAIKLEPENWKFHFGLGLAEANQRKWGAAAGAYRHATRLNPAAFDAYVNLGAVLQASGNQQGAIGVVIQHEELLSNRHRIVWI